MNINPANIFKTIEQNSNNSLSANSNCRKKSDDISVLVSEKLEQNETSGIKPNYSPQAPVVKINSNSKNILEVITYEDILEKSSIEFKSENPNGEISIVTQPITNTPSKMGTGFYLTIPKSNLEKLSSHALKKQNNFQKYNSGSKIKKGVLVDLVV